MRVHHSEIMLHRYNLVSGRYISISEWYNLIPGRCNLISEWYKSVSERYKFISEQCKSISERCRAIFEQGEAGVAGRGQGHAPRSGRRLRDPAGPPRHACP